MNFLQSFFALFADIQGTLISVAANGNALGYIFIAGIIFCETGLVFTPFLPGDSLLFAAGALSATGIFNIFLLFPILCVAAIIGDSVNYSIGRMFGERIVKKGMVKKEHYEKAQAFSKKHGNYAIVLARFVPILRTVVPFFAGISNMPYQSFFSYNVLGGLAWVTSFTFAGFFFGNIPFVQAHFELIVLSIIFVSLAPLVYQSIKATRK